MSVKRFTHLKVGRIRENVVFGKKGLDIFVCGDQLLRGAALNAVLIGALLLDTNNSE
jgi:aspartate-semialdehyde dehydrogenase